MNLLGVGDANFCFTLIDAGAYRRENDSSVFSNSSFEKAFSSGELKCPPNEKYSRYKHKYAIVLRRG